MKSFEPTSSISVPNPKRAAIFEFFDSDHAQDGGGYLFDSTSPPVTHRSASLTQNGNSSINFAKALTSDISSELNRNGISNHHREEQSSVGWEGLDFLGVKSPPHSTDNPALPPLPSLSSLASPWVSQPTSSIINNHADVSFEASISRAKSGFGGILTSGVGIDLQWSLAAPDLASTLPASRGTSAIGMFHPDVPVNTPQPISRPVSTIPATDQLSLSNVFQRAITPPVSSAGTRSESPRLAGLTTLGGLEQASSSSNRNHPTEESRWPKPIRFSMNSNQTQRSSLLDTPNYGSNQHLDGLLGHTSGATPNILRPTSSSSIFPPDSLNLSAINGSILNNVTENHMLKTRSGRDSIGSPFPASHSLIVSQTELPLEALEQYRQSREPTPQIPSYPNHHHGGTRSPPPYNTNSHQNHFNHNGYVSRSPGLSQQPSQSLQHHNYNHHNNSKSGFSSLDDRAIENVIVSNCYQILLDAAEHMLKAVELANTLRARVGTEVLAQVRERWGGLLSLLEKHKDRFLVERIPKNDRIRLIDVATGTGHEQSSTKASYTAPQGLKANGAEELKGGNDDSGKLSCENNDHLGFESDFHAEGYSDGTNGLNSSSSNHNHTASRCLHVGNVPNTYTDAQLTKEFEKFGVIEGLKLINQKNGQRRFAFITYESVEQAIAARHALSKLHPWKSAISFAHKDLLRSGNGYGSTPSSSSQFSLPHSQTAQNSTPMLQSQPYHYHYPQQHNSQAHGRIHNASVGNHRGHSKFTTDEKVNNTGHLWADSVSAASAPRRIPPPLMMRVGFDSIPIANTPSYQGGIEASTGQTRERIILQRLCDDTYVPTQPWPIDDEADMIVGQSIIDQIVQFGGNTTISKLRGFLKHRMGTVDNIKSVPLKAMLLAYPQYFHVDGSYISLVANRIAELDNVQSTETEQVVSAAVASIIIAEECDDVVESY
jgi:RNA recognition motif-containing protein